MPDIEGVKNFPKFESHLTFLLQYFCLPCMSVLTNIYRVGNISFLLIKKLLGENPKYQIGGEVESALTAPSPYPLWRG
jgi:hypothetical protein